MRALAMMAALAAVGLAGCSDDGAHEFPVLAEGSRDIAPGAHVSFGVLVLQGETTSWHWTSDGPLYTDVSASQGTAAGMVDGDSRGSAGTYTVAAYSDHMAFTWGNKGTKPVHIEYEIRGDGRLEWSET